MLPILIYVSYVLAVATVVNRIRSDDVTVAVDGSLYRFHPHFHDLMQKKVTQLVDSGKKVGTN